ncbi:HPr family phosphocarrier protein [Bacillaceae bacterium]
MIERKVTVAFPSGLHARPATQVVKKAGSFRSEIKISKGGKTVDAKSIMGVMSLAAGRGEEITLTADGPDEQEAIETLSRLISEGRE